MNQAVDGRRQKNPQRDRELTESFHRMLATLKLPPRSIDGDKWNPVKHPIDWPGWMRVRVDVRFLK